MEEHYMLKLLIADDEKHTRESIYKHIHWDDIHISQVKLAKNGIDALEIVESFHPDILLCDIRMPRMNGIELAENIRRLFPSCKIIFLSGYADKEYFKSAISLKVVQYVEKPIDFDELKVVIGQAAELVLEEKKEKVEATDLKHQLMANLPLAVNELTLSLIREDNSSSIAIEKICSIFSKFNQHSMYVCAVIWLYWDEISEFTAGNKELVSKYLLETMHRVFSNKYLEINPLLTGIRPGDTEIIVVKTYMGHEVSKSLQMDFYDILKKISDDLNNMSYIKTTGIKAAIGVGHSISDPADIHSSYVNAVQAVKHSFYRGFGKLYTSPVQYQKLYEKEQYYKDKFLNSIPEDIEAAEMILKEMYDHITSISNIEPLSIKKIMIDLFIQSTHIASSLVQSESDIRDRIPDLIKQMESAKTFKSLSTIFTDHIRLIFKESPYTGVSNKKSQQVIQYIVDNYSDPTLSIKMIADKLYMNQNYLCTLFKKNTGKTINNYINEYRVIKAKLLLSDSSAKIYEVAEKTGFSDPNYFSTIFKKHTGLNPTKFVNTSYKPSNE